jgi:chitinase
MDPYSSYRTPDPEMQQDWDPILDSNGKLLYESVWGSLLHHIIADNDVTTLQSYIAKHPRVILFQTELYQYDSLYVAASSGALDALRVLLDYYHANPALTKDLETRPFSMVELACEGAHIDMVKFLLDEDPLRGTVYAKEYHGGRALLCATRSLGNLSWDGEDDKLIDKREELINMLLDRGSSVRDANRVYQWEDIDEKHRVLETALGNAIKHAGYNLLSRLIANGANVHAWQWAGPYHFGDGDQEATALHIGSLSWNLEGVQALLDNRGDTDLAEMVFVRDSRGRLPLHWAAGGLDRESGHVCGVEDSIRSIGILKLLIESNPGTINVQDKKGRTALHYAVDCHMTEFWDTCRCFEETIRFLCEHGADASIQDEKGRSVLYIIGTIGRFVGLPPINRVVLDILVAHGGRINDADEEGETALHILTRWQAKWLRQKNPNKERYNKQMETCNVMVKYLQEIGGSMDQRNAAGETPQQLLDSGYRDEGKESSIWRPALTGVGRGRGRG